MSCPQFALDNLQATRTIFADIMFETVLPAKFVFRKASRGAGNL